jgi:hypothetical protein
MAMIATLAALVLGLLTASAKNSLDEKESQLRGVAAQVVLLDRTMAAYGEETKEARDLLKQMVVARISQIWPEENATVTPGAIGRGSGIEAIQRKLLDLSPQTDAQRWLQSTALQTSGSISASRWVVNRQFYPVAFYGDLGVLARGNFREFRTFRSAQFHSGCSVVRRRAIGCRLHLSDPRNGPALQRPYQNLQRAASNCFGATGPTLANWTAAGC